MSAEERELNVRALDLGHDGSEPLPDPDCVTSPEPQFPYTINIHHSQITYCEFTYSLKFICNPKPIFMVLLRFIDMCTAAKNLSSPTCMFLAEVEQENTLPSHFSCYNVMQCGLFSVMFFAFGAFCW